MKPRYISKMAVNMGKCVVVLLLLLAITAWAQLDHDEDMMEESLDTDVSLDEFDLEETCDQVAQARWNYHLNPTKQNLQNKINEEQKYGDELRREAERMTFNLQLSLKSSELQRKIELLAKPGAALLSAENFNKVVGFSNNVEDLKYTKYNICSESSVEEPCEMMNLQDMENAVTKQPRNAAHLWKEYSAKWPDLTHIFSQVLHLANEEATLNGAADVQRYWEDITEFPPGYNRAASLWKQIQPLYKQLHHSISSLISKQYNKATIPLLYLGSVSGTDWSSLADIIFTRSNSQYQHIKGKLRQKEMSSVNVYRAAEKMVLTLGLEKTSPHFWNESKFDQTCPTKSTPFCKEIRITTCTQPDWLEYLTAHEVMMQVAHRHLEESLIFRENNHHSALHEAVSGLGALLAATPKQLQLEGILPPTEEDEEDDVKYTFLILMALHTLPRLPYYLAADMWRLEALKNNQTDPAQLRDSWIKLREEMQMVSVPHDSNDWLQLLSDPYIVNNKPYLGKFVGVILQFQLLELLVENKDVTLVDVIHLLGSDDKFRALLQAGFSKPWPDVLEEIAKISYIDAKPLLNFFNELEDALDQEVGIDLPADSHSDMKTVNNVDNESEEMVEESTEKETVDEPTSTEREEKVDETETETVTGIRLADVQNQNVSAEIPSNTETENKTVESSGIGTILLFSITAVVAVVAVVAFFLVGRKRFVRSHLYRQPPDQNTPA